jgi:signal peptidase I
VLRLKSHIIFPLLAGLIGAVVILSLASGTVKIFQIPTDGMAPTIRAGDYILATRIFSPEKSSKRGDLVIFDARRAHSRLTSKYVQRLAAVAGDRLEFIGGQLHVNGVPLPERAGQRSKPAHPDPEFPRLTYPLVIPPGEVFTVGDNYGNSLDSRYFGPFPVDAITHSADRIVLPTSRAGKLD